MQTIFSFSVKSGNSVDIVKQVKAICKAKGLSFSFVVVQALSAYLKGLTNA